MLEVLECASPALSGAAADYHEADTRLLIDVGLLVSDGHEQVSASPVDHADQPAELVWSQQHEGLATFDSAAGFVAIPVERLQRHAVNVPAMLTALIADLDVASKPAARALVDDMLWEISAIRLGRVQQHHSVWFARRLFDPAMQRQASAAMLARPHPRVRILLTSTPGFRLTDLRLEGAIAIPVADVLCVDDDLAISPEILTARVSAAPASIPNVRLSLSADNTQLRIDGGEPIHFKSDPMKRAIRTLVDAHRVGRRVAIRELTDLGSLEKMFGRPRWARLKPFVTVVKHGWGFEL